MKEPINNQDQLERELIGSCLTYEKALDTAINELTTEHFKHYAPVWKAIVEFYNKNNDHEDILFDVQRQIQGKDSAPSHISVHDFIEYGSPSVNYQVEQLSDILFKSKVREVSDALLKAASPDSDTKTGVLESVKDLSDILNTGSKEKEKTMSEVMVNTMEMIDRAMSGEFTGMKTGLDIDNVTNGFQKQGFYILAARPSMGKTSLAIQVAESICDDHPVVFMSLETHHKSIGMRYLANKARIDSRKIMKGKISTHEHARLIKAAEELSSKNIYIDDSSVLDVNELRTKANYYKRKHGVDMIVIDYVQLIKSKGDSREQQVAEISRACVAVAKEFDICVLGLAQLNRESEKRTSNYKRPILSDLRESGQLEQDAYCVMLLHRPEHYGINEVDGESTAGLAEIDVAKNKDGGTGRIKMHFTPEFMRFENLAHSSQSEAPRIPPTDYYTETDHSPF